MDRLRKGGICVFLAAGLWLATVVPAQAASDAIDQSQTSASSSITKSTPMAQTFTAGITGQLDRVTLMMSTPGGVAATVVVQIQTVTAGGQPSGTVLGTSSFTGVVSCCRQMHDFAISPAAAVTSGTQYAIVVSPTSGSVLWYESAFADAYAAGQLWLASGSTWTYTTASGYDFCFQTWVVAGAVTTNTPPTVAVTNAAVTANEGAPVTNGGTYSDPDGDAVALSASIGTLTRTGSSSGTWSWSLPAADESAVAQTVTITADDGQGFTATASFTVTVVGVVPTVTIGGAPVGGPEGTAIHLTGTATSPSAADNAAGITLSWTVTKDGSPFATGTGASLSFTPVDEGTFNVTLQAVDDGGQTATATATVNGTNVAPIPVITSITHSTLVLVARQPVTFTASFTDPGALDTHTGTVNYGDGTPVHVFTYAAGASGGSTDTHGYAAAGTYTVTYTVADDDGGVGTATAKVTVETPAQALGVIEAYVQGMTISSRHQKADLVETLKAAMASAAKRDSTKSTCRLLDQAIRELSGLGRRGRLSAAASDVLASMWAVHRALGCTKIKVGWVDLDD